MVGLGRYYELDVRCRGEADAQTGYFLDIKVIDRAARGTLIEHIARACVATPMAEPAGVLAGGLAALDAALGRGLLVSVRWRLTPTYSVEVAMAEPQSAVMRQRFEFAAAHRLHAQGLSDEENRRVFGKCNNPSGHGHNYVVEASVVVGVAPGQHADAGTGAAVTGSRDAFTLASLEEAVDATIMNRLDHTNLNVDVAAFDQARGGVNPSVEHIARFCFELLAPEVARRGARLREVCVWETEKTSATYPG